ncbi:sigma factor [Kyrpidia tusciae]
MPIDGNRDEALDLTQETFIRAFHDLDGFQPGDPLSHGCVR